MKPIIYWVIGIPFIIALLFAFGKQSKRIFEIAVYPISFFVYKCSITGRVVAIAMMITFIVSGLAYKHANPTEKEKAIASEEYSAMKIKEIKRRRSEEEMKNRNSCLTFALNDNYSLNESINICNQVLEGKNDFKPMDYYENRLDR